MSSFKKGYHKSALCMYYRWKKIMEIGLHFLEELLFTSKYYLGNTTIPFLIDFDRS